MIRAAPLPIDDVLGALRSALAGHSLAHVGERREDIGERLGIRKRVSAHFAFPKLPTIFGSLLLQDRATDVALRPVLHKGLIELKRLGHERLKASLLRCVNAIGGPNQKFQDQRQQQCCRPDDRADHVARPIGRMRFRQKPLQKQPQQAAREYHCSDKRSNGERGHARVKRFGCYDLLSMTSASPFG